MLTLMLMEIDKFIYKFVDSNNKEYIIKMEFHGFEPQKGDMFIIGKNMYKKICHNLVAYGLLDNASGKYIYEENLDNIFDEIIIVKRNDGQIILKRLYG